MSGWGDCVLSHRIASVFAGVALTVFALGAAPAAAQTSPSTGVRMVPVPNVPPTHLAAARDLVTSSGLSRSFGAIIPGLMNQINVNVTRTRPELVADMKTTLDALQPEFQGYSSEMVDVAARVITALMTEQQCKDAAAFFHTPAGVAYVDAQPSVFANMTPILEQWSQQLSVRMLDRVRVEMKKKGKDF